MAYGPIFYGFITEGKMAGTKEASRCLLQVLRLCKITDHIFTVSDMPNYYPSFPPWRMEKIGLFNLIIWLILLTWHRQRYAGRKPSRAVGKTPWKSADCCQTFPRTMGEEASVSWNSQQAHCWEALWSLPTSIKHTCSSAYTIDTIRTLIKLY